MVMANLGKRFYNAMELLLPNGDAWKRRGCESSLISLYLRSFSDELARFQIWYELILKWSIERFGELPLGWSAVDYEGVLKAKFGVTVTVTDEVNSATCESHCESLVVGDRVKYLFVITVDDLSTITSEIIAFIDSYKQSHTDFIIRDRHIDVSAAVNLEALHCESVCTAPLYSRDYVVYTLTAHWSYTVEQLVNLPSWQDIMASIPPHATLIMGRSAT